MSSARLDAPARRERRRAGVRLAAFAFAAAAAFGPACSHGADGAPTVGSERLPAAAGELVVETAVRHQHITGFGASSAWTAQALSSATADLFFTADKGIGLSLLRMHIYPDGTSSERSTAQSAYARGAKVWAAPWSPPGAWKTSGTDNYGGSLLPEYYQAWADRLAAFAASMNEYGVPLYALSSQNEPNWVAEWETCVYTPEELKTFIRDYLGPALRRESPGTLLLAPESIDWITLSSYAEPLLDDPATNAEVGIVAVHAYGGTPFAYTAPAEHGKEFWETEVSYDDGDAATLVTAREVHKHLAIGQVNAFHYWWLISDTTAGLMRAGKLTPQAYGLAHFSKFVRPGFVRVEMPIQPASGIFTSAYFEPGSERTVIVAVNETAAPATWSFRIDGPAAGEVEPWVTTANEALARQTSFAFEGSFDFTLDAASVTTLVIGAPSEPPPDGGGGEGGATAPGGSAGERNGESGEASGGVGGAAGEAGAATAGRASRAGSSNVGGEGGEVPVPRGGRGGRGSAVAGETSHSGNRAGTSAVVRRMPGAYSACSFGVAPRNGSPGVLGLAALVLLATAMRRRATARCGAD